MSPSKTSFDFELNGNPRPAVHPGGHVSLLTNPSCPVCEFDVAVKYAIDLCRLLGVTGADLVGDEGLEPPTSTL